MNLKKDDLVQIQLSEKWWNAIVGAGDEFGAYFHLDLAQGENPPPGYGFGGFYHSAWIDRMDWSKLVRERPPDQVLGTLGEDVAPRLPGF